MHSGLWGDGINKTNIITFSKEIDISKKKLNLWPSSINRLIPPLIWRHQGRVNNSKVLLTMFCELFFRVTPCYFGKLEIIGNQSFIVFIFDYALSFFQVIVTLFQVSAVSWTFHWLSLPRVRFANNENAFAHALPESTAKAKVRDHESSFK